MTDDELLEAMARAVWDDGRFSESYDSLSDNIKRALASEMRAALAICEPEVRERCAKAAENVWWDEEAHPESIYAIGCKASAAAIRKGSA